MGYGTEEQAPAGTAPSYQGSYQSSAYPNVPQQPFQVQAQLPQQQPGPFLHAYVMGAAPPSGPVCVYDVNHIKFDPSNRRESISELLPATISANPTSTRAMIVINYGLGILFIPHLISVIGSLHAYQTGLITANRTAVLVLSLLEIAAWFLAACASWSFVYPQDYPYSYYTNHAVYFGWVYIVLWFLVYLGCGIPRLYLSTKSNAYAPLQNQEEMSFAKAEKCRRIALGLYIAGIFVSPLEIVSLGYTLHLLNKGQIVTKKAALLACSVLELCGWIMGASLSWAYTPVCHSYYNGWYYYSCRYFYWGWVFLIVWFAFAIACGIPRIVLMNQGKKPAWDQHDQNQSYAKL